MGREKCTLMEKHSKGQGPWSAGDLGDSPPRSSLLCPAAWRSGLRREVVANTCAAWTGVPGPVVYRKWRGVGGTGSSQRGPRRVRGAPQDARLGSEARPFGPDITLLTEELPVPPLVHPWASPGRLPSSLTGTSAGVAAPPHPHAQLWPLLPTVRPARSSQKAPVVT